VRLSHVRFSPRIFTTHSGSATLGLALVEADAAYFSVTSTPPSKQVAIPKRSSKQGNRALDNNANSNPAATLPRPRLLKAMA
jgi:hypothetical protein